MRERILSRARGDVNEKLKKKNEGSSASAVSRLRYYSITPRGADAERKPLKIQPLTGLATLYIICNIAFHLYGQTFILKYLPIF